MTRRANSGSDWPLVDRIARDAKPGQYDACKSHLFGTATTMDQDQEWLFKDFPAVVPIAASGFAFAFVVGYFLAFDISWFPFFSLSEHVVFALRALPIAIGASVALLIALTYSELENHWTYLQGKRHWFAIVWICTLVLAGILAYLNGLLALCMSFLFVALGAFIHYRVPTSQMSLSNILYWITTVMVLTLMAGYLSAHGRKAAWEIDKSLGINLIPLAHSSSVQFKKESGIEPQVGQVIFVGSVGVLFYEYRSGTAHLFRWESIQEISECRDARSCL
jgi:hypothetical protein